MGWKNVKEHYKIGHLVQVVADKGICIGSSYIHDLIVIGLDGEIKRRDDGRNNEDLRRYMQEFDADSAKLKQLVETPDTFERSITVYTYDGDYQIIEKACELPGWPNVTHDGEMMFENKFSTDRAEVVKWAKMNVEAGMRLAKERLEQLEQEMAKCKNRISRLEAAKIRLT